MRLVLELLLETVLQPVLEAIIRPIGRVLSRPWRALVRRLDGRMVLMLWGAVLGVMTIAWRVQQPGASDGALVLALAAFMAAPVFAIAATVEWRQRRRRERMHTRRLRRRGAY